MSKSKRQKYPVSVWTNVYVYIYIQSNKNAMILWIRLKSTDILTSNNITRKIFFLVSFVHLWIMFFIDFQLQFQHPFHFWPLFVFYILHFIFHLLHLMLLSAFNHNNIILMNWKASLWNQNFFYFCKMI